MANIASEPCTETSDRTPPSAASNSRHATPYIVAVVTGGSGGLGRAIVRELAELGYDVAVLARESEGLQGAAREVDLAGQRALAVPVDVADAEAVDAAAERVEQEL